MLAYVEVWYREKKSADYRRHGFEEVEALLDAGTPMTVTVDGAHRQVIVDRAARTAVSIAAVGTLWVTEA